jgi:hypothetical protein
VKSEEGKGKLPKFKALHMNWHEIFPSFSRRGQRGGWIKPGSLNHLIHADNAQIFAQMN